MVGPLKKRFSSASRTEMFLPNSVSSRVYLKSDARMMVSLYERSKAENLLLLLSL